MNEEDKEPLFSYTPELRQLQEKAGLAIEEYLRAIEERRLELGILDREDHEGEYITDQHFLTAWAVIAEFTHPTEEVFEPVVIFGKGRSTTPAHAMGLGKVLMEWW